MDSKGKAIEGVSITMQNTREVVSVYKIVTKKNGSAVQNGLANHVFLVTVEKEGYQTVKRNVKIPAGLMQEEEFTLYTLDEVVKMQEDKDPRSKAINLFNQAASFINERKFNEALDPLQQSIALDGTIFQAQYYLGFVFFEQGKFEEALQPLLKVIPLKEDHAPTYRLLAAVYEKLGNKAESEKYTKIAQEKGGRTPIDAYNEGIDAFNKGDADKAITAFEEALQLDQNFADAYYRLGLCYLSKEDNGKAVTNLQKYIEMKPDGEEVETAKSIIESLK